MMAKNKVERTVNVDFLINLGEKKKIICYKLNITLSHLYGIF